MDSKLELLHSDSDFIAIKRFGYSLQALLERYPEEAPESVIAQALMVEEEEIPTLYDEVVKKLRELMNIGE